jgi:hypothetical protein
MKASLESPKRVYRLHRATLAVYWREGKGEQVQIPAGSVISDPRILGDGSPFVEISWNSRPVNIFAQDFQMRAELLPL